MADMIVSSLHTPDTRQSPAAIEPGQEQATPPIAVEAVIADNIADSMDTTASIDLDPNAPTVPAAPIAPVVPAGLDVRPAPEEEELDELIIEDFTIDGICGVY